ncbi:MAG: UvrD-helicase domain-containing protein, partial [Candidatus Omnitrophica bacterium]|nr:UvrD-helicase domain-containing protein [Candidatus Omnitrophota bacterium]
MEKKYRPSSEASLVVNVEASAGSGKTYTLAKRYIYLLLKPQHELDLIPLRYILAITFTNKATVEMKERILEFLKKIALDVFSSDQEEKEILFGMEKKYAKNRAEFVMD